MSQAQHKTKRKSSVAKPSLSIKKNLIKPPKFPPLFSNRKKGDKGQDSKSKSQGTSMILNEG